MDDEDKRQAVFELLRETPKPEERIVALIHDGKQFSVRIPREFASVMNLDKTKHKFKFTLERPPATDEKTEVKLRGEIIAEG